MFVFPAFNESYTKRKRTYKCCVKCRSRRVKCIIKSADYETTGCENCRESGLVCDLTIKNSPPKKPSSNDEDSRSSVPIKSSSGTPNSSSSHTFQPMVNHGPTQAYYATPYVPSESPTQVVGHVPYVPVDADPQMYPHARHIKEEPMRLAPIAQQRPRENPHGLPRPEVFQFPPSAPIIPMQPVPSLYGAPMFRPMVPELDPNFDIRVVTAKYLKDRFGFIITTPDVRHYNAYLPIKLDEKYQGTADINSNNEDSVNPTSHIKSKPVFDLLISIHAFTISTPGQFELSEAHIVELLKIYFFKINSVFPIIDETDFWQRFQKGNVSSVIVYALVLAIAKDSLCDKILGSCFTSRKPYNEALEDFNTALETKIRQLLLIFPDYGCDDKLDKVIIFTLLSLQFGAHKLGNEQSSQDLFCAISNALGLSIHMNYMHEKLIKDNFKAKSDYFKTLWWILYIFDRFNAVVNSKAFVIKDADFNIDLPDDALLQGFIAQLRELQAIILIVFQPALGIHKLGGFKSSGAFSTEMEFEKIEFLKSKAFKDITIEEYRVIQFFFLNTLAKRLCLVIYLSVTKRVNGTNHEINPTDLTICQGLVELLHRMQQSDVESFGQLLYMEIPFIPSYFSLIYTILIKSETKRIILQKVGRKTPDANDQTLSHVAQLFKVTTSCFSTAFNRWWFFNKVMGSVCKLVDRLQNSRPKQRTHQNKHKKRKITKNKSQEPSDRDAIVTSITSISSPTFTTHVAMKTKHMNIDGVDEGDFETSDGSDSGEEQLSDGLSDLVETGKWIEVLSDDLFAAKNLSEYFSEDPTFQEFCQWSG